MYLKISFMAGCILACPFVLYQVWLFISPGLYQNERRYIVPFMSATVGLFLAGALLSDTAGSIPGRSISCSTSTTIFGR